MNVHLHTAARSGARTPGLALCLALAASAAVADVPAAAFSLRYLGQQIVPTGTQYAGTTVGGLSALDHVVASGSYVAISDDRSALNPARYYGLQLDLSKFERSATPGMAGVRFDSVTTLQRADGTAFTLNTVDPEGLRLNPATGTLYWSNEGQRSLAGFQAPTVREMRADGSHVRDFTVPARFLPQGSAGGTAAGDSGIFNNLAFETMALSTDGRTLYTATENGLAQDSLPATVAAGSRARILAFDVASGLAGAEYVYEVAPVVIGPTPQTQFATNGLTDMVAVGERQFISIERSFAIGAQTPGTPVTGNTIRLFAVDARNATDVSGLDTLAGASVQAVTKTLLLDLASLRHDDGTTLALDNIEGITLGPVMNGRQTLLLVSDNNFSPTQFTQFVALQLTPVPEPATLALLLAGVVVLAGVSGKTRPARPRGR